MKIRTGFVSNSSSSSFIALATVDAFEEAVSRLKHKKKEKLIKYLAENSKAFGQKVKIIKEFANAGGFSSIWGCDMEESEEILENAGIKDDEDDSEGEWTWEAVGDYVRILEEMAEEKEWKDKVFTTDVGDEG